MKRLITTLVTLAMAFGIFASMGGTASANALAGGGYSSSYAGESVFTEKAAGETGQFSAIFFNEGSVAWVPGVVGLLICLPDKITCSVASPNAAYASGWFASTAYATVTTTVGPGQNAFFIYNFKVPDGTVGSTAATFNGDVGIIQTGAVLRPQGYYQINTTPPVLGTISISPTSASLPLNGTVQFSATTNLSGTINWSVTGGCGAVTSAGLFVATATNSSTQPCAVVASAGSVSASAPITVFGPATQITCAANPSTVTAGGGTSGISTLSFTLKDANGNVVANATSPAITVTNSTPSLATLSASGSVTPSSGVASVTLTTTTTSGNIVVSASTASSGIQGCTLLITSAPPGTATSTKATFVDNPIAADGVSTSTLRVDVTDANGNRTTDSSTVIDVSRTSGAGVCNALAVITGTGGSAGGGSGSATTVSGRVEFSIQSTSTPGTCTWLATPRNTAITSSSATLTTNIVGAANRLAVVGNTSPASAGSSSTITVTVDVQDALGQRITSATNSVTATLDTNTCTGAGGGNVTITSANPQAAVAGRTIFTFTSLGAYSGCQLTFSASGVSSAQTQIVFTPGAADHLGCTFNPSTMPTNSTTVALVTVRDQAGNVVTTGTYSVNLSFTSGSGVTQLLTSNPQTMTGGTAAFQVKSLSTVGTDTYTPSISGFSSLSGTNTSCNIAVQ